MERKYLKQAFDHNEIQIQKVVNGKVASLRAEIEASANHVFLIYDELCVAEQDLILSQEETSDEDKKFSFGNWMLLLFPFCIYFIDLLLSQDAIQYLLPASVDDAARVFFSYLVPALFVIADLGIGLVRHKIKSNIDENLDAKTLPLNIINVFGFFFCLILPALVGATILAYQETADIAASEVTARASLMVLSFILHAFVIFMFPKGIFDSCIGYNSYKRYHKTVQKIERELYKKISELSIAVLNYKQKADKYAFVQAIDKIEFAFRNRLLVNQIAKGDPWNKTLSENTQLQNTINDDEFFARFFPYKPMPIPTVAETELSIPPLLLEEKQTQPKGIYITYVQNDSSLEKYSHLN